MKLLLKLWGMALCLSGVMYAEPEVDLVVFSKNRPLQCYSFLESCEQYVSGVSKLSIIYCADEPFKSAYEVVKADFPYVNFVQQSSDPRSDFQKLTCKAVFASNASHVIFAVDDIVVIDQVDLRRCAQLMDQYDAYAFYLRLGTEIDTCYSEGRHTGQPRLKMVEDGVYAWRFCKGTGDWGYPHSVDMALFRKRDVRTPLLSMIYSSPNTFEAKWSNFAPGKMQLRGLCFTYSKIVNLPLNIVQKDFRNRHEQEYTADVLLEKFNQGFKMDIALLYQLPHNAPHTEYAPTFISR